VASRAVNAGTGVTHGWRPFSLACRLIAQGNNQHIDLKYFFTFVVITTFMKPAIVGSETDFYLDITYFLFYKPLHRPDDSTETAENRQTFYSVALATIYFELLPNFKVSGTNIIAYVTKCQ